MKNMVILIFVLVAFPVGALTLTVALSAAAYSQVATRFSRWVDSRGNIELPTNFRTEWSHLGSWSVVGANGDASFHDVYTEPESVAYFREHQEFPDGATLVKEVRGSESGQLTTGNGRWATVPQVWFVMVKDTRGRFEANPLWGDGWGWALFDAKDPSRTVTTDYSAECISCHIPAKETDWVYVQGYPTLGLASQMEMMPPKKSEFMAEATLDGPVVTIRDLTFSPDVIRVSPGETITWVNQDDFVHTATAHNESFDTGTFEPGQSAQVTFDETGTYPYFCTPHPFMKATVVVED